MSSDDALDPLGRAVRGLRSVAGAWRHSAAQPLPATEAPPRARTELADLAPQAAPGSAWEALTRAAAAVSGCALARLRPVDAAQAWLAELRHPDPRLAAIERSLCALATDGGALLEVVDAADDPLFAQQALVAGAPGLRFLAAQPLLADGLRLGTLCLFDTAPRRLDTGARLALRGLADAASALLLEQRERRVLTDEQGRLADFLRAGGDWLWETDAEHRVVAASSYDDAAPGYLPPIVAGLPLDDAALLDAAGAPLEPPQSLHELLDQRRAFGPVRVALPAAGGPVYLALSATAQREAGGHWAGYRGVARDIGAAVLGERARRVAETQAAALAAQLPGLACTLRLEPEGRLSLPWAGPGLRELFGAEPADVARDATRALAYWQPEDRRHAIETLVASAADLSPWRATLRVRLPGRAERVIEGRAGPQREADGSVLWQAYFADVTDAAGAAQRLEAVTQERDAALRSTAARGELMSRVSHELRTPLNAVLGFAQLIQRDATATHDGVAAQSALQIRRAGEHLLSLLNDMLDMASLEAGGFKLALQPVALLPVVDRCLRLLEAHAAEQGIRLEAQLDGAPPAVRADVRAVRQLLFNLVGNAIKFSPAGSAVQVRLRWREPAAFVTLEVQDQGPGIPPEQLAAIFEPFTRVGDASRGTPGSGLGLAISRQLAAAMDGRIEVQSAAGLGTCFIVQLPVDDSFGTPVDVVDSGFGGFYDTGGDAAIGAGRVLYVEDEPVNALLMQQFFASLPGLELHIARNGAEGLALADTLRPDLVLLDMNLPDLHGLDMLRMLRADPRDAGLPIVALSADAQAAPIRAARAAGCDDYWTKPIDFTKLQRGITHWLAQVRAQRDDGASAAPRTGQ